MRHPERAPVLLGQLEKNDVTVHHLGPPEENLSAKALARDGQGRVILELSPGYDKDFFGGASCESDIDSPC